MFSGGTGPWEQDPKADGWWGDDPPFRHPVFVLTHHPRERRGQGGGTTFIFVTDGIEAALERAKTAAGDLDVGIGGGADIAQQYLRAGLVDTMHIHVAPLLLGGGTRLFGEPGGGPVKLEPVRAIQGHDVVHLTFTALLTAAVGTLRRVPATHPGGAEHRSSRRLEDCGRCPPGQSLRAGNV